MTTTAEDFEVLLNDFMPFLTNQVSQRAYIIPCGLGLRIDDSIKPVIGATKKNFKKPLEVLELVRKALKEDARKGVIKAAVVAYLFNMTEADAQKSTQYVRLDFDHLEKESLSLLYPYKRNFFSHKVTLGEPRRVRTQEFIFKR